MRDMVGALTSSAAASSASDIGPPNTKTDKADSRGGLIPVDLSSRLTILSSRIAAE